MPRGPKGEKSPADVIGAAIMVGRIATGEILRQTLNTSLWLTASVHSNAGCEKRVDKL